MMNTRDQELLKIAIDYGYKGLEAPGGAPIGAVIATADGEIVVKTHNRAEELCDPTAHGEIVAIRDACKKLNQLELKGYTIYCSAEPCPMCLTAIYWSKIDRIVYAVEKEKTKEFPGFIDDELMDEMKKSRSERWVVYDQDLRSAGVELLEKFAQQEKEEKTK